MQKKIIIVSPAGAVSSSLVEGAAAELRRRGMQVEIAPHACSSYGRFSASEAERLSDLQSALDSDADYILCSRGGYGVAQIIDRIRLPQHPPIIIGFSDITALHCLMGCHHLPSIHGNMAAGLSNWESHREGNELLLRLLEGELPSYELPSHRLNIVGSSRGILRGGNLSLLVSLQGTPYACPIESGDILFLEDIGEEAYAIDRMLHNLRLSGVLSRLGGLVIGQWSSCEDDPRMPSPLLDSIVAMVRPYGYPVLVDFPAGHIDRNLPLVLNSAYSLDVRPEKSILRPIENLATDSL